MVETGSVTAAFHFLTAKNEFYVVYGNDDNLSTEPSLFLKRIRYTSGPRKAPRTANRTGQSEGLTSPGVPSLSGVVSNLRRRERPSARCPIGTAALGSE